MSFAVLGISYFADAFHSQWICYATEEEGRWNTLDMTHVDWIVESFKWKDETKTSHFTTSDGYLSHSNIAHFVRQVRRLNLEIGNHRHGQ